MVRTVVSEELKGKVELILRAAAYAAALVLILFVLGGCAVDEAARTVTVKVPLGSDGVYTVFKGIYDAAHLGEVRPISDAVLGQGASSSTPILIVPHHLTAAITIAAGIQALINSHPKSILLLSPDHFHVCGKALCTASVAYKSPLGDTEPDLKILRVLESSPLVEENDELFQKEHGIYAVAPFIAKLLPGTRLTPLVIAQKPGWKNDEKELLQLIKDATASGAALVISSDFSHYLPLNEARKEDELTLKALTSGDLDAVANLDNPSQSDCPACLWTAVSLAKERATYNPQVILHTNSATILNDESAKETTSHFAIAF